MRVLSEAVRGGIGSYSTMNRAVARTNIVGSLVGMWPRPPIWALSTSTDEFHPAHLQTLSAPYISGVTNMLTPNSVASLAASCSPCPASPFRNTLYQTNSTVPVAWPGGGGGVGGLTQQQFWVGACRLKLCVEQWWQWIGGSHRGG
jgi:hypothetical protein